MESGGMESRDEGPRKRLRVSEADEEGCESSDQQGDAAVDASTSDGQMSQRDLVNPACTGPAGDASDRPLCSDGRAGDGVTNTDSTLLVHDAGANQTGDWKDLSETRESSGNVLVRGPHSEGETDEQCSDSSDNNLRIDCVDDKSVQVVNGGPVSVDEEALAESLVESEQCTGDKAMVEQDNTLNLDVKKQTCSETGEIDNESCHERASNRQNVSLNDTTVHELNMLECSVAGNQGMESMKACCSDTTAESEDSRNNHNGNNPTVGDPMLGSKALFEQFKARKMGERPNCSVAGNQRMNARCSDTTAGDKVLQDTRNNENIPNAEELDPMLPRSKALFEQFKAQKMGEREYCPDTTAGDKRSKNKRNNRNNPDEEEELDPFLLVSPSTDIKAMFAQFKTDTEEEFRKMALLDLTYQRVVESQPVIPSTWYQTSYTSESVTDIESRSSRSCVPASGSQTCDTSESVISIHKPHNALFPDTNLNINDLPVLNLVHIFKYMSRATLLRKVSCVCKYWYCTSRDPLLWRRIRLPGQHRLGDFDIGHLVRFSDGVIQVDLTDCMCVMDTAVRFMLRRCRRLQSLKLGRCQLVNPAFLYLAPGSLPYLQALYVGGCYKFDDDALSKVAQACPNLRTLHANPCTQLTDAGITALAQNCPELRELNLENCKNVGDAGIEMLVQHCPKLSTLNVMQCQLTSAGILNLGKLPCLTHLELSTLPAVGTGAIVQFARRCRTLVHLNLSLNRDIDDNCISEIAKCFPKLNTLYCVSCPVTDRGIAALVQHCPKLTHLDLGWCMSITDEAVRLVSKTCHDLKFLGLIRCDQVTPEVVDEMLLEHPQVHYSTFIQESRLLMRKAEQLGIHLDEPVDPIIYQ